MADILCDPFPIVPPVPLCSGDCSSLAALTLCKIPRNYPRTTAISTLQEAYTFTNEHDFDVADVILPNSYNISTDSVLATTDLCETESAVTARSLYSYIDPISTQEAKTVRDTEWVLGHTTRLCTKGTTGITKGPSYISLFNAIQEVITPPTVTPGITPGKAQRGTKIPKPKGDCDDGVWVLTYVDGRLQWVCDRNTEVLPPLDCSKLKLTVNLYDRTLDKIIDGDISILDINDNYKNVAARVNIEYEGTYMPMTLIQLSITQPELDPGKDHIVTGSWFNSYGQQTIEGTIGPLRADRQESGSSSTITTLESFQDFPILWSAKECYQAAGAGNYSETFGVEVLVPDCPDVGGDAGVIVNCEEATGVLTVKEYTFVDEFGSVLDPENAFGLKCDESRSKTFYIAVTYINDTDNVYMLPESEEDLDAITVISASADVSYNGGKLPTLLKAGETVTQEYKIFYELLPDRCTGELSIDMHVPSGGTGSSAEIKINKDCDKCPSYVISDITFHDPNTGELVTAWDTGCVLTASRQVNAVIRLTTEEDGDYNNRTDERITIDISSPESAECTAVHGEQEFVVPSIKNGEYKDITVLLNITAINELDDEADKRTITVSAVPGGEGATSVSSSLEVTTTCGVLSIHSCNIYQYTGSDYVLVNSETGLSTDGCDGVGTVFELVLGYQLQNTTNDYVRASTGQIEFKASGSGDWSPAPSAQLSLAGNNVTLGPWAVSPIYYSSRFVVTPRNKGGKGKIKLSMSFEGQSCDSAIDINKDCETSTPEGEIQSIKGGNCIEVVTGTEEGEIVINSTLVPADDTIEIKAGADENAGKCLISAKIPTAICSSFEEKGNYITVSLNNNDRCQINCTLQKGDGISISESGSISVDSTWLGKQIAAAIDAWFADSNNVTTCK